MQETMHFLLLQKMMRGRIVAQGLTIVGLLAGIVISVSKIFCQTKFIRLSYLFYFLSYLCLLFVSLLDAKKYLGCTNI